MPSFMKTPQPILIVEDNLDIRESFKTVLELEGYLVETASNGKEALDILGRISPAVIFLDLNMPIMGGREFLAHRHQSGIAGQTPVIVFAATKDHEPLQGVSEWLGKP